MMRIAMLGRYPGASESSHTGPSRVAYALAEAMVAAGHEVGAFDVTFRTREHRARLRVGAVERIEIAPYDGPGIVRALARFAPDVVHVHGTFAAQFHLPWLMRKLGRSRFRIVTTVHGVVAREKHQYRWAARIGCPEWLQRGLLAEADAVVANSEQTRAALRDDYGVAATRVIGHGVEPRFFAQPGDLAVADEQAIGDRPMLLFVGNATPMKGLEVLLAAVSRIEVDDWVLVLAGRTTRYFDALRQSVASRLGPDRIMTTGPVDQARLVALYGRAAVCVLPSRFDAFGLAGLEAMAAGRPLVASDRVGMKSLIDSGVNGLIVPWGDAAALAAALQRLLEDPAFGARLGAAARSTAAAETWASKAAAYLELFEALG